MDWILTTPSLILLLACVTGRSHAKEVKVIFLRTLAADVAMIVFGVAERYYAEPLGSVLLVCSCGSFLVTMRGIYRLFVLARASVASKADGVYLSVMQWVTVLVWSCFPLVRLANFFGVLSDVREESLYPVLDFVAKVGYSVSLMTVNYSIIDKVLEGRLLSYKEALQAATTYESHTDMVGGISHAAQREALAWRKQREERMLAEGMPESRVQAFLDVALQEYIALASGDISAYLQPPK